MRERTRDVGAAILGLGMIQFALPKLLPLPGISDRWLLFVPGGGGFARLAAIVGGVVILAFGVSLLPPRPWSARRWGLLSAAVALGIRLLMVGIVLGTTSATLTHYPWGSRLPPEIAFIIALGLIALCYGGGAAGAALLLQRGRADVHKL